MKYRPDFLAAMEEQALLWDVRSLPFRDFEFHGFTGKRKTVSFGWRYDFNGGGLTKTDDVPPFLSVLRERAEEFAGNARGSFQQVLVTEYRPAQGLAGTETVPFSAPKNGLVRLGAVKPAMTTSWRFDVLILSQLSVRAPDRYLLSDPFGGAHGSFHFIR